MAVVTIFHEMGAGGSVIGMALAERLEYRYVDQDMISQAARRARARRCGVVMGPQGHARVHPR